MCIYRRSNCLVCFGEGIGGKSGAGNGIDLSGYDNICGYRHFCKIRNRPRLSCEMDDTDTKKA